MSGTQQRLAEALEKAAQAIPAEDFPLHPDDYARRLAAALLPVVEAIAAERAAEELLGLADTWHKHGWTVVTIEGVRARATALTADGKGQ